MHIISGQGTCLNRKQMNFCSPWLHSAMRTTSYEQAATTQGSLRIPSLGAETGARAVQFVLGVFFVLIINKRTGLAAGVRTPEWSRACVLDTPERILMDECSGGE